MVFPPIGGMGEVYPAMACGESATALREASEIVPGSGRLGRLGNCPWVGTSLSRFVYRFRFPAPVMALSSWAEAAIVRRLMW